MTVEFGKITFQVKVIKGKDGIERNQLPLSYVSETPPIKPRAKSTSVSTPTKPSNRQFTSFIERSLPREYDE